MMKNGLMVVAVFVDLSRALKINCTTSIFRGTTSIDPWFVIVYTVL